MPPPLDPTERQAILDDIQAGELSRNAIARKHQRSVSTVTGIAKAAGETEAFDRSQTLNATRARSIDLADGRARLQERWLAKANEALDRSESACVVFGFGGQDNRFASYELELPPAGDYRSFVTSAAVATDKMLALAKLDAVDDGLTAAVSTIDKIMDAVRGTPPVETDLDL